MNLRLARLARSVALTTGAIVLTPAASSFAQNPGPNLRGVLQQFVQNPQHDHDHDHDHGRYGQDRGGLFAGPPVGQYWAPVGQTAQDPRAAQIAEWYRIYLGREASPREVAAWVGRVQGGTPMQAVQQEILSSQEFFVRTGGGQNYVNSVTRLVHGKPLPPDQAQRWQQVYGGGGDREAFVGQFLANSGPPPAAAHGIDASQLALIDQWYHQYLNRHASDRELDAWGGQLAGGMPLATVQAEVMGGVEFSTRVGPDPTAWIDAALKSIGRNPTPADERQWLGRLWYGGGDRVAVAKEMLAAYGAFGQQPAGWQTANANGNPNLGNPNLGGPKSGNPNAGNPNAGNPNWYAAAPTGNADASAALVREYYRRYLGRDPRRRELTAWQEKMSGGTPPSEVVVTLLAEDEFYRRAGRDDEDWIVGLFGATGGTRPQDSQVDYWQDRLDALGGDRHSMTHEFLKL